MYINSNILITDLFSNILKERKIGLTKPAAVTMTVAETYKRLLTVLIVPKVSLIEISIPLTVHQTGYSMTMIP